MELREALDQISQIRVQMAQTTVFRGYRSLTVGFSGVLGVSAAVGQAIWLPRPLDHLDSYALLWLGVAALAIAIVGAEIGYRAWVNPSALARQHSLLAIEHFIPCLVAGGLLTIIIVQRAPAAAWMLPGLWAIVFSLGVFASQRLLPRSVAFVGLFYLVGGAAALAFGNGPAALSPWWMGLLFGGGQFFAAAILYFTLERNSHGRATED